MRALSAALSLLLLSSLVAAQAEPGPAPAEPGPEEPAPAPKAPAAGEEIRKRGAEDAALLLPQRGLGGDDSGKVEPDKTTLKECKIEVEGCEKMTGYVLTPDTLPEGRKVALMFTFHGNGDLGKGRVQNVGRITTARDPVITIGVQYQELTPEGGGKMGMPTLATQDKIIEGSKWLLKKVMAEQPVDPARVFVSGFSWGTSWASGWARKEWMDNPDAFPFRAVFLYSSGGAVSRETCPPVPWINFVGSEETAVLGSINVVASVRHYSNTLAAWGIPVQYHEIPKMGHAVNGRCHQITRDVVNDLGGPGRMPYGTAQQAPEAVTFEASTDALVLELQKLCNEDRWKDALARVEEIAKDKKLKAAEKAGAKKFPKEMEKAAKAELARLEKALQQNLKDENLPRPGHVKRVRAICEAWPAETWVAKKGYLELLARFEGDFAPVRREREREAAMREALSLESQADKRAEAKAAYEALAKRKAEDSGSSIWPQAAEYRLMWWQDLE